MMVGRVIVRYCGGGPGLVSSTLGGKSGFFGELREEEAGGWSSCAEEEGWWMGFCGRVGSLVLALLGWVFRSVRFSKCVVGALSRGGFRWVYRGTRGGDIFL